MFKNKQQIIKLAEDAYAKLMWLSDPKEKEEARQKYLGEIKKKLKEKHLTLELVNSKGTVLDALLYGNLIDGVNPKWLRGKIQGPQIEAAAWGKCLEKIEKNVNINDLLSKNGKEFVLTEVSKAYKGFLPKEILGKIKGNQAQHAIKMERIIKELDRHVKEAEGSWSESFKPEGFRQLKNKLKEEIKRISVKTEIGI